MITKIIRNTLLDPSPLQMFNEQHLAYNISSFYLIVRFYFSRVKQYTKYPVIPPYKVYGQLIVIHIVKVEDNLAAW